MARSAACKDFILHVKNVALLVFFVSSLFTVIEGSCDDCKDYQTCCGDVCIDGSSCYCSSDWDCSGGERCCSDACVNGSNCLGQTCSTDSDCSSGGSCCGMKCKYGYDCIGQPCSSNADCGSYEYCCGDTCGYHDCSVDDAVWIILGSIFGSLFFILAIFLCVYRRRRPAYGRVLEGQRVITSTTITNPPYLGQSPPSYQQGYPYYPPPQYVQYPPYTDGTTKASEPPPPYSGAPEGRSGGVSSAQNNYGAV